MSDTTKRYLLSSAITFITAFLAAIAPMIGGADMTSAGLFALAAVGARAGVKALVEYTAARYPSL